MPDATLASEAPSDVLEKMRKRNGNKKGGDVPDLSGDEEAGDESVNSRPTVKQRVAADTLESVKNDTAAIALCGRSNLNEVTSSGHNLLFIATSAGFVEGAAALCAAGAVLKRCEVKTLLKMALKNDRPAMIEALAKTGVDLSSLTDRNGDTYLHLAAEEGKAAIVKAMLDGGVDVDMKGFGGWTALHVAASEGHLSTVQLLLSRGAAVNFPNDYRSIPLHEAAGYGHAEVVAALCAAGADINWRDGESRTPLGVAMDEGESEIAELLRSEGAFT